MSFRTHSPGKAACSSQHCYSSSLFNTETDSSWATPKAANRTTVIPRYTASIWTDSQKSISDTHKYCESCVRPSHWTRAESKWGYSRLNVLNKSCFSSLCSETYNSFSLKLPFSFEEQSKIAQHITPQFILLFPSFTPSKCYSNTFTYTI